MSDDRPPRGGLLGRALGLVMLLCGLLVIWGGLQLRGAGVALVATWLGPFAVCVGLSAVVEGPALPVQEATPLLRVMAVLGSVCGVVFVLGLAFL